MSLQSDGVTVQPDGVLTIKLRIPISLQGKAFKLFRLREGTASEAEYTVDGDYAVITTDRLSEFIFVADGSAPAANTVWLILVIILSVIIAGEVGFIAYRQVRKNKSKENKK